MGKVQFYATEIINDRITMIRSMTGELMYLLEGAERAALIDTCLGVGHLKEFVEGLTDKPLTVIVTHGHIDHAMGAAEFGDVYMNHEDMPVFQAMKGLEDRKGYIMGCLGGVMPPFEEGDFIEEPDVLTCKDLRDGDEFDLGGLHLDIYSLPGHTPGTMIVLVREEKVLITGDACNTATFIWDENSSTVESYQRELKKAASRLEGKYDRIFMCHHDREADIHLLQNVIEVCQEVMDGKADDMPYGFMGQKSCIAKAVGERFVRLDGGFGNIIYSKDKVKD